MLTLCCTESFKVIALLTRPETQPHSIATPSRARARGHEPRGRATRIILLAAAFALVPAAVSFLHMLTQPSNSSLGIRAVEWLRDNGARGLVNDAENFYYSLSAPRKGGPPLRSLPRQPGVAAAAPASAGRIHIYSPPPIAPVIHPALIGEGRWRATLAGQGARPPVLITSFRPDPAYPRVVAGVAWIDHTRTSLQLYPGRVEPAVALPSRGPMEIPPRTRGSLVAAFNSAFKLRDSGGGFVWQGRTYARMTRGEATVVRYRSGRVDIVAWPGDPVAGPGIDFARQDLPLIVNSGRPNPNLADGPQWGATLGNAVRVWRSGLGIDRRGNLIYAAANYQTVGSLAAILIHAGAIRAMELDINAYWPSFITYRRLGGRDAANLLPDMQRSPLRYLTPDDRDFFAVLLR